MRKLRTTIILSAVMAVGMLTSCSRSESEKYIDIDSLKKEISDGKVNALVTDFEYDEKPFNIMKLSCTIDSDYFYDFMSPNVKINLSDGMTSYVCDLAGCGHTENSSGCGAYIDFVSPVATADGIYYVNGNKVMLYADGSETEILSNSYLTDYEKENYPDHETLITAVCIYGRQLFVICPSYWFTYDLDSKEIGEMQSMGENLCMSFAVSENYVCYANQNLEMFVQDKNDGENTKLADKVGQVSYSDGRLYYIRYDGEIPVLYGADENGENPVKLVEDCYVNYYVTDSCIYYQNFVDGNDVYKCDLNGENAQKLVFDNLPDDYSIPILKITSCGSADSVFFIDEDAEEDSGLMFTVKNGETDTTTTVIEKNY